MNHNCFVHDDQKPKMKQQREETVSWAGKTLETGDDILKSKMKTRALDGFLDECSRSTESHKRHIVRTVKYWSTSALRSEYTNSHLYLFFFWKYFDPHAMGLMKWGPWFWFKILCLLKRKSLLFTYPTSNLCQCFVHRFFFKASAR